jgi:hypothetical protein
MHRLPVPRPQVHLDALGFRLVARFVMEVAEVEIAIQFAIDARQQVEIECRCHAGGIVIGGQQAVHGLYEIGTQQQAVARAHRGAQRAQEFDGGLRFEIADGAAQEEHQEFLTRAPAGTHFAHAFQIAIFDGHYGRERLQFAGALRQRRGGNIDREIG